MRHAAGGGDGASFSAADAAGVPGARNHHAPDGAQTTDRFVSGVSFDDGTRTKTLTAADFDENGHCTIRFIRARGVKTSVCHSTRIYQDGKLIYKNR